jgi:hypothetical protein
MTQDDIVKKFIEAKLVPSKYTVKEVLGFSAQTLVRRGHAMQDIKDEFNKRTLVDKHCPCCLNKVVDKVNTYCSQSCSATYNNKLRVKLRACECCNAETKNKRYCSSKCQQKAINEDFLKDWLSGLPVKTAKGGGVSSRIRKYLFSKFNNKCSKCEWGETHPLTLKVPLEVEHINGDSSDNSPENLTLLCPNCHSLTLTYKALNKGNGRHNRMQRYKEGKSY